MFQFPNNEVYSKVDLDPPVAIDGSRGRGTVIEVEDGVLIILAGGDPERVDVDEFLAEVDKVLATVEFS